MEERNGLEKSIRVLYLNKMPPTWIKVGGCETSIVKVLN